ncbi:unnamed protein product [Porites evermanni]|uniref:Endonuclease/exonuclease/phosphatase domain-containing protein n=1 Tax=Porites evermanni TaxID=104178 RepID=A0ABN8MEQ3_9CNID|nr:unnamed protein product [Porites evermanni]
MDDDSPTIEETTMDQDSSNSTIQDYASASEENTMELITEPQSSSHSAGSGRKPAKILDAFIPFHKLTAPTLVTSKPVREHTPDSDELSPKPKKPNTSRTNKHKNETLVSDSLISAFHSKWKGPSFWSPALGKQGGTVILVRENSCFEIKKWQRDSSGRIVSILASLGELNFNLVIIYAPTNLIERKCDTNLCEGKIFFDSLRHFFFPHSLKIIGGDFNCFESEFDKFQGNICISSDLRDFRTLHRWIDI